MARKNFCERAEDRCSRNELVREYFSRIYDGNKLRDVINRRRRNEKRERESNNQLFEFRNVIIQRGQPAGYFALA